MSESKHRSTPCIRAPTSMHFTARNDRSPTLWSARVRSYTTFPPLGTRTKGQEKPSSNESLPTNLCKYSLKYPQRLVGGHFLPPNITETPKCFCDVRGSCKSKCVGLKYNTLCVPPSPIFPPPSLCIPLARK